jgi:hypothetical protein
MKKALLIVAVVAAYAALETTCLLSVIATNSLEQFPTTLQAVAGWAQFLLIPGMAALMSRIMYGPYVWPRRTLTYMLLGAGTVLIAPLGFLFFGFSAALLLWSYSVSRILFAVLLPVVLGGMIWAFVFLARKTGKWTVRAEAERWLAERKSGVSPRHRKIRNRAIRIAICIPSLIALTIFLFLPETWGLATHLRWRNCCSLSVYKVHLPANWIIYYYQGEPVGGRSYVNGHMERGIALGGNPWRYDALSSWSVETWPPDSPPRTDYDRWTPKPEDIVERRTIKIPSGDLNCVDYRSNDPRPIARPATVALVDCWGPGGLHAGVYGPRQNLEAFYRVLGGITETK